MTDHALTRIVDTAVQRAGSDATRVASELAAFACVVASSPRLAKMLAAGSVPADAKRQLVNDLAGSLHGETTSIVAGLGGEKRLSAAAYVSALTDVASDFTFVAANGDGRLDTVENGLYEFARAVDASPELRDALSNPAVANGVKGALVADLLSTKVDSSVIDLVKLLIALDNGRDVADGARELSVQAAARRNLVVAEVETAVELDDDRRSALTLALSNVLGQNVQPRFSVNPAIIGSVVVRVGDEIFDGSVRHSLDQARLAVVGAQ